MNKQTANSLFMFSPIAAKYAELYQQLLMGVRDYQQLGNRLIRLGEQANTLRDFDKVREIGQVLSNLPIKSFQSIGYYFLAIAANNKGNGDQEEARRLFELAVDTGPALYKTKAILGLAAVSVNKNDFESGFYYYQEAIKAGRLSVESLEAIRGMSLLKSLEGYHDHALTDLENILPIAKYAPGREYFNCLNSYAVELCEIGRLEEAKGVSSLVISSPLVRAYPEWQETYSEVNQKLHKRRSTVAISIPKPKRSPKPKPEPAKEPNLAKILQFPQSKAKEFYKGIEMPALTPIQWLAAMMKTKYGAFLEVFIPDASDDIDRFCETYLDFVVTFYE